MQASNFASEAPANLLQSSSLVLWRHGAARPHSVVQRPLLRQGTPPTRGTAAGGGPHSAQPPQRRKHSLCTAARRCSAHRATHPRGAAVRL